MSILKRTVVFLFLLCVCLATLISNILYTRIQRFRLENSDIYLNKLDERVIEHMQDDVMIEKFQKRQTAWTKVQDRLVDINLVMRHINEKQVIRNSWKLSREGSKFENTVLVIKVHNKVGYLAVLIDSLQRVKLINRSLVIFAHDCYNIEINSLIRRVSFARVMQVFYPYSAHMYPSLYPGSDRRFCTEVHNCMKSDRRNATLVQRKLFWWWVTSHVFDQIKILSNYDGYIYFLETELYLTVDFIPMSKTLERLHTLFCPECHILSLGARAPRLELYAPGNNKLVVDVWGQSNYSNSAIGFNRKTWNEIKLNKKQFCYFNDSTWELSLKHLASKSERKQFLMLSSAGPRVFPTSGCGSFGNGTNCTLYNNYMDILNFLHKIEEGLFPENFKLRVSEIKKTNNTKLEDGRWEDARDKEFCMFIARKGNSPFY